MSRRTNLLNEVAAEKRNPFVLCRVISQRTRQLASGGWSGRVQEAIDTALRELLDGKLQYEIREKADPNVEPESEDVTFAMPAGRR
jgi:DNA-directed RNA polymerase subunit K/omega